MEEQQAQRMRRKFSDEFKRDATAIVRPLIQSLWIGDRLSTMERLCITSFLEHGHPFASTFMTRLRTDRGVSSDALRCVAD